MRLALACVLALAASPSIAVESVRAMPAIGGTAVVAPAAVRTARTPVPTPRPAMRTVRVASEAPLTTVLPEPRPIPRRIPLIVGDAF